MRKLRGSVTVEASFLVPFILLVLSVTITLLFYYHDKVTMKAVLHETIAVMSGEEELTEEMVESYFSEQIRGKLLLFPTGNLETRIEDGEIYVKCTSVRRGMELCMEGKMKRTRPETWVRTINNLLGAE